MKKFLLLGLFSVILCLFPSCAKKVDYKNYVSEVRSEIYIYQDDGVTIKAQCGKRETPYAADGIKGELGDFFEIYITLPAQHDEVWVQAGELKGEANYNAAKNCYYLSEGLSAPNQETLAVTLTCGNTEQTYTAINVRCEGLLTPWQALDCAKDYKSDLFAQMTQDGIFTGEIMIRLLYDDACYYFVGICGSDGKIVCCLVDGVSGKIIAERMTEIS